MRWAALFLQLMNRPITPPPQEEAEKERARQAKLDAHLYHFVKVFDDEDLAGHQVANVHFANHVFVGRFHRT